MTTGTYAVVTAAGVHQGDVTLSTQGRLGEGGEGVVYRHPNDPSLVAKVYKAPAAEDEAKLLAMLRHPPQQQTVTRKSGEATPQIAWPRALIYDRQNGTFAGYLMPLLPSDISADLSNLFSGPNVKKHGLDDIDDYRSRLYIAHNFASVVRYIHEAGHALVDIKPQNIKLYKQGGLICLVDCDGFSIADGGELHPASLITPQFLAPEAQNARLPIADIGFAQDNYALAILIYQIIGNNLHPAAGVLSDPNGPASREERLASGLTHIGAQAGRFSHVPWSIFDYFELTTQHFFYEAFTNSPTKRPTAKDWQKHLHTLFDQRLQNCAQTSTHFHMSRGCPFCVLDDDNLKPHEKMAALRPTIMPVAVTPTPTPPPPTPTPTPAPPLTPKPAFTQVGAKRIAVGVAGIVSVIFLANWAIDDRPTAPVSPITIGPGGAAQSVSAPPKEPDARETRYFELVLKQDIVSGYQSYLKTYPQGAYADRARLRLQELGFGG